MTNRTRTIVGAHCDRPTQTRESCWGDQPIILCASVKHWEIFSLFSNPPGTDEGLLEQLICFFNGGMLLLMVMIGGTLAFNHASTEATSVPEGNSDEANTN